MTTPGEHYLLAVLVRDVEGPYAELKGGEIVKVTNIDAGKCTIERLPERAFPAVITGVPTTSLDFDV